MGAASRPACPSRLPRRECADAAGTGIDRALAALGVGLAGVAVAAVPLAAAWAALALALGRAQQRLARGEVVAR